LSSINDLKQIYIEDYFEGMQQSTQLLARNPLLSELARTFNTAPDTAEINRYFTLFQQEFAYQDLLIFDTTLQLVYQQTHSFELHPDTAFQPVAFRNFLRASLKGENSGEVKLESREHILFTSALLKNETGQNKAVLLVRLPFGPMEYVLNLRNGIGQTGESYVVGPDRWMRSHSRFFPDTPPHKIKVHTLATENAYANQSATHILDDYRGIQVLSAYHKLNIPGLNWVIISEIDLEEAMQPVYRIRTSMIGIGLGVCLLVAILTWFVSIPLSRRIRRLREVVLQLSKGILPKEQLRASSQDEIGQMRGAINQLIMGLQRTSLFASEIGNGHLQSVYEPLSPQDTMGNALLQMRDKLQASHEKEGILSRQRTVALLEGEENERRRISRELHDGIGQLLTAIQFKINSLEGQEKVRNEIKAIIDETIIEIRRISNNLMPSVLVDFGLEAALKSLCNRTAQSTNWKVNFVFDTHPNATLLPQELVIGLYRIAQEGINNAVKYARATQLDIIVDDEPDHVQLRIRDNGVGFDWEEYEQKTASESNGIRNMRERTHLLGGHFQLITRAGVGTTLTVSVPHSTNGQ
jgi:signal transduction histidine kinase